MEELAQGAPAQAAPVADTTTPNAASQTDAAHAAKKDIPHDMHVKVYAPFKVYYDDKATSVSAINDTGPFDILPGHRNFMTLVSPCELIIRTDGGENKIKISRAVMHVKANDIKVFLDV